MEFVERVQRDLDAFLHSEFQVGRGLGTPVEEELLRVHAGSERQLELPGGEDIRPGPFCASTRMRARLPFAFAAKST